MARNGYKRSVGKTLPREKIVVFTEGAVTEVEYLRFLCGEFGIPKELITVKKSRHTDPKGIVDEVATEKRLRERSKSYSATVDQWWAVVDTECGRAGLYDAAQKARDNKIFLALSDPSIEYWLLLHFKYTTKSFANADEVLTDLKTNLSSYNSKNKHPDMSILYPLVEKALDNARLVRKNLTQEGSSSPRTDFDLLVRSLQTQSNPRICASSKSDFSYEDLSIHYCELRPTDK